MQTNLGKQKKQDIYNKNKSGYDPDPTIEEEQAQTGPCTTKPIAVIYFSSNFL